MSGTLKGLENSIELQNAAASSTNSINATASSTEAEIAKAQTNPSAVVLLGMKSREKSITSKVSYKLC